MGERKSVEPDSRPIFGPFQSSNMQPISPMFGPFQSSSPEAANSSPMTVNSSPASSGGMNHNFGNVSVFPPRAAENAGANPYLNAMDAIGDKIGAVTDADDFLKFLPNGFNDGLTTISSAAGVGSGMEKISRGEYWDGGVQTAKSVFGMADGVSGLAGYGKASNIAGGISSSISAVDNVKKAWTSDDLGEATQSARGALNDGFNAASDFAGGYETPWGWALKGGGLAAKYIGTPLSNGAERISKERGYFHDDAGSNQSASAEAGDWGRSVDGFFGHSTWDESKLGWAADKFGGLAGGVTSIAGGIGNTAYTYGHRATDAIGDAGSAVGGAVSDAAGAAKDFLFGGPSMMDIVRAQLEKR